jgi:hypothetical protein
MEAKYGLKIIKMEKAPHFNSVYPFKLIYSITCYFKTNYVGSLYAKNYNMPEEQPLVLVKLLDNFFSGKPVTETSK